MYLHRRECSQDSAAWLLSSLQGLGPKLPALLLGAGEQQHPLSHSFFFLELGGQAEDRSPDSGEPLGRKVGVSMVTADLGLVSMIRQGILALQLLPSNSSAGQ